MSFASAIRVDDDLSLVPRSPADAAEMYALVERYRTDLRDWLTWIDGARTVHEIRRYAQYAQAQFEAHVAFDYAIRSRGELVGAIGLHDIDWASRNAQFGYYLAPPARRGGVVTRACRALERYAFERFELHRLEIRCVVENARSRAVPERLGYAFEGTLAEAYFLHGAFRDLALYAMTVTRRRASS